MSDPRHRDSTFVIHPWVGSIPIIVVSKLKQCIIFWPTGPILYTERVRDNLPYVMPHTFGMIHTHTHTPKYRPTTSLGGAKSFIVEYCARNMKLWVHIELFQYNEPVLHKHENMRYTNITYFTLGTVGLPPFSTLNTCFCTSLSALSIRVVYLFWCRYLYRKLLVQIAVCDNLQQPSQ